MSSYRLTTMYVSEPDFRTAVESLRALLDRGEARILVSGSRYGPPVRFEFKPDGAETNRFRDGTRPTEVLLDVTDVVAAMISGFSRDRFASVRQDPARFLD